jgi:hypothetical protein
MGKPNLGISQMRSRMLKQGQHDVQKGISVFGNFRCFTLAAELLVFFAVFWGCGYHMAGKETHVPQGISSVAIPTFVNRTFEPGIEIQFTQEFLNEFIHDRRVQVVDRKEADSILEGTIKSLSVVSASYNQSFIVRQYQTTVVIDLVLRKKTGEVVWTEKDLSETRWYRVTSDVLINEASKTAAIQQMAKFIAERMRSRFFYQF